MRQISGIAIALTFCAAIGPLAALARAPAAASDGPILVISLTPAEDVRAAGGALIGPYQAPFAVMARGDEGFVARLKGTNAWFLSDGRRIAEICGLAIS